MRRRLAFLSVASLGAFLLMAFLYLSASAELPVAVSPAWGQSPQGGPTATPTPCGASGTWSVRAPLPVDAFGVMVASDGTYAYAIGGYSYSTNAALTQVWRYDPVADTWTSRAALPAATYSGVAVYGNNGNIYVFGGTDATDVYNTTRIYNISSNSWSTGAVMPGNRQQMAAGYSSSGKIYIAGGYDSTSVSPQDQTWEYDIAGNSWATRASMPQALGGAGSGAIGTHMFVAGGRDQSTAARSTLYDYDMAANTWTSRASLPTGVNVPGAAVANGRLAIFGGGNPFLDGPVPGFPASAAPFTTGIAQLYDPVSDTWSTGPSLNVARSFIGGAAIGTIYIVAVGGFDGTTSVATNEVSGPGPCITVTPVTNTPTSTPTTIPTSTNTPTSTSTPTSTPTNTVPAATNTPTRTPTGPPPPTSTPTNTSPPATGTSTNTPTNTNTPLPTQTPGGPTATPEPSDTSTPTFTSTSVATETSTPVPTETGIVNPTDTATPVASGTATQLPGTATQPPGTATPTSCPLQFEDVPPNHTFYAFIRCMVCRGIINGYPCGGPGEPCNGNNDPYFRPGNNVTRGQIAKIVSNSAGFNEATGPQQFEDVPLGSTFYDFIWRLTIRGIVSGYPCGGPGEPCGPTNRPYFRPNGTASRGQLGKIVSEAAGFNDTPTGQTFEDVPIGSTFYLYIERLATRDIMEGYPCGGPGEPCVSPTNRPYFRPSADVTRGQTSKIVANTFFPDCYTPSR